MANCGVPCTTPLFWTFGYCKEYGFYEILHTRQIPNTISLKTLLSLETPTDESIDLGPLFQLVYNMHRCGVYHGALSTKNILIDPTGIAQVKFYLRIEMPMKFPLPTLRLYYKLRVLLQNLGHSVL